MLQVLSNEYVLERDTLYKKHIVWPEVNRYFCLGVHSYLGSINILTEKSKIIFVDFQLSNLSLLLEKNWLVYAVCNRLVLITDTYLLPLANYYKGIFCQIDSVILHGTNAKDFFKKIDLVISGEMVLPELRAAFSSREIYLLRALISGVTIKDLAKVLQLSPKTVYALRHNILNKMGLTNINDIFIRTV